MANINTYNAKLSYKGEGGFTFTLPKYGELTIYNGKDIYVKGLTVSSVELLRQLRPLMLEHQLNAKADGCYKVIDLNNVESEISRFERAYKSPIIEKSVADLKAELVNPNTITENIDSGVETIDTLTDNTNIVIENTNISTDDTNTDTNIKPVVKTKNTKSRATSRKTSNKRRGIK